MKKFIITLIICFTMSTTAAMADGGVDYKKLERSGFKDVVEILEGMTPEQRAQIMQRAEKLAGEMEGMSNRDRIKLESQVRIKKGKLRKNLKAAAENPESVNTNQVVTLESAKSKIGINTKKASAKSKRKSGNSMGFTIQRTPKN